MAVGFPDVSSVGGPQLKLVHELAGIQLAVAQNPCGLAAQTLQHLATRWPWGTSSIRVWWKTRQAVRWLWFQKQKSLIELCRT